MDRAKIASLAMLVGAIAFASFWIFAPTTVNDRFPWVASLAVHGVSIIGLGFGLGVSALVHREDRRARTMLVGVGVTVAGLLTAFPLIPIGLGVVGLALLRSEGMRIPAALLLVGSAGLVAAYASGARVGMEDAAPMSSADVVWFQVSVAVTAAGLFALGRNEAEHDVTNASISP